MPEGNPREDYGPFKSALEENIFKDANRGRNKRLQGLDGHEDLVVRVDRPVGAHISVTDTRLPRARQNYQADQKNEATQAEYRKAIDRQYEIDETKAYREYLSLLESKYGIKNSGYMPVIGKGLEELGPQRYIVTDKIQGVSGEGDLSLIPEHALLDLLRKLVAYYKDLYNEGGITNLDMGFDQFVYDPQLDEMILVDHEPAYLDTEIEAHSDEWRYKFATRLESGLHLIQDAHDNTYPELSDQIRAAFAKRS